MPNFSGIWTVTQQMQAKGASTWPATPGAPTIGTATAGNTLCASVAFTAPACAGYPATITGYRVVSTPGCFTQTGASSPLVVTGLASGTSYTFKAQATNSIGYGALSAASNSITATSASSQSYTSAGTYTWVAPTGVTSVSVVVVGSGKSSSVGGALAYKNNISTTPGNSYTVFVSNNGNTCRSYFINVCTVSAGYSTLRTGDGGGDGANPGGAGGYSGNGGTSSNTANVRGAAGTGGGGGGGGFGYGCGGAVAWRAAGGGVGLFGQGASGAGGIGNSCGGAASGGGGGSGGCNGGSSGNGYAGNGGAYGGGAGSNSCVGEGTGASSAIRIVWPGSTRTFPSTNVGAP